MRHLLLALATLSLAPQAMAQSACVSPPPVGDPCMVGHWMGRNNVPDRLRGALQGSVPDSVIREVTEGMPPLLGISIYADGFYHTLPFHHDTQYSDKDVESGEVRDVRLDIVVPTQVGYINGRGGQINFCDAGSAPAMFSMTTAGGGYAGSTGKAPTFTPAISYSCSGRNMSMSVNLPAPIGTVEYELWKLPESAFDETFGLVYDAVEEARRLGD